MTIKVKLSGGLGNQMFQFATGYAVAKKINVKLTTEQKQNLDTCNDSILRQMGRQDQVLYSTEKFSDDDFHYSYNPPLSFWNFNIILVKFFVSLSFCFF